MGKRKKIHAAIPELKNELAKGNLSRRDFIRNATLLGVSAAAASQMAGFMLPKKVFAATPRKGGFVRMAAEMHGPDDQMDPIVATSTIDYTRMHVVYNGLVQILDNMSLHPELAGEWSVNKSATEYTFKIRKGVHFHDGSPMTGHDVVWSMRRHLGKDSPSVIKALMASVDEWKLVDTYTVKAILNSPDADLPAKLGEKQAKIVKKDTKDFKKGNGTGPFVLKSFEPGVKSTHARNKDYWRDRPYLDEVEITAITDPIARVNALIAGDVQLITAVDAKSIRLVEQAQGVHISSTPTATYGGICCLKNTMPGKDDDFVKGMQYIQDRERIVRSILKGHGMVGNDQPISPAFGKDHCHELPQREYDPDKAKWHLNKAGISTAELYTAPIIPGLEEMCLLMQANLKKIGFDLKIKRMPTDGYWGSVWMKEPMNVVTWNMRPTANAMLALQFAPGGAWNDTFWNNERVGELLKLSLAETDPVKRHGMYCEMQTLVHNGSGMVIPYHVNSIDGINDKIHGIPKQPLGFLGGCEWPEFAWIEA
ncbi:MAG: ABC transporter substrate-binding protein [Deltaproteobacteria bacterium]|nr:ABC transporter substrate-binding protein [Deltaproteobacteria bacterium]MBW2084957.1 ABC transporter substrate-binding protein [Deltaproteobacteria bacterium]